MQKRRQNKASVIPAKAGIHFKTWGNVLLKELDSRFRGNEGRGARLHYNDGKTEETVGGSFHVVLDHTWQHESPMVTGLSAKEIMRGAKFKSLGGGAIAHVTD